jgi:hypothetical protein
MKRLRPLLPALLFLAVAPAVARADDAKNEAKLKARLESLEKDNEKLRSELEKANGDTKKLFDEATKAEKAAGLEFKKPTAVASPAFPAASPPVGQAASKHANLRLQSAELVMNVSFAAPRTVRSWRVYDTSCDVTRKGR